MQLLYGGALYEKNFIQEDYFNELQSYPWETKRTARHEMFMSNKEINYSYGNRNFGEKSYESVPFIYPVEEILAKINDYIGSSLNACFLNKYDNEQQHLGWHADDFAGMNQAQPIAVISFGAEREIWIKCKGNFGVTPLEQRILLERGSLFIMPAGFQDSYFHKIPKHDRPCGPRISLTYRMFN